MQTVTLVLLPGMDGTGFLFEPLLKALPTNITPKIVAYPADRPLDYSELKELVCSQLPNGAPFFILGESFGGPLAIMTAAERPPGLKGVILCCTFARAPVHLPLPKLLALFGFYMFRLLPKKVRYKVLDTQPTQVVLDLLKQVQAAVAPKVWAKRASAVCRINCTEQLRNAAYPLLVLTATEDGLVRQSCHDLILQLRPDASHIQIKGPHLLLQHAPVEASAVIAQFIKEASAF